MSDFKKALIFTAIPIVVVSIIGTVGMSAYKTEGPETVLFNVWLAAGGLALVGFIAAVVLAVRGQKKIAAGIFAGVGIGIVAIGVTCFANIAMAI